MDGSDTCRHRTLKQLTLTDIADYTHFNNRLVINKSCFYNNHHKYVYKK